MSTSSEIMKQKTFWQQYGSLILILGGILVGALIGAFAPSVGTTIKPIGDIFLNLLFTIVVPLVFVAALLTMLDEIDRMVRLIIDLVMLLAAMPFLFLMLRVVRLHVAARGAVMTVRPTIGRMYSFPVSEITKVIRKVRPDPMGAPIMRASIKKLTICTKARRVVLCESITGIEAIDAYLARHVDPEHIVTKT